MAAVLTVPAFMAPAPLPSGVIFSTGVVVIATKEAEQAVPVTGAVVRPSTPPVAVAAVVAATAAAMAAAMAAAAAAAGAAVPTPALLPPSVVVSARLLVVVAQVAAETATLP